MATFNAPDERYSDPSSRTAGAPPRCLVVISTIRTAAAAAQASVAQSLYDAGPTLKLSEISSTVPSIFPRDRSSTRSQAPSTDGEESLRNRANDRSRKVCKSCFIVFL